MTNSRPDFSKLYSRIYDAGLATGGTVFGSTLAFHVIAAECDGFMSQRLLPQQAESLWKDIPVHGHTCVVCRRNIVRYCLVEDCGYDESVQTVCSECDHFSYISEDDGQVHYARTIDWSFLNEEVVKHDYECVVCERQFRWSSEDISWEYEHPFMPCGHSWKALRD